MKVRLDAGLPAGLVQALSDLGHDVDAVPPEGGSDAEVWAAAQRDGRFLVTQTLDVSDPARYVPGTHRGLLLVRLREPGRKALSEHVQILFETEEVARWASCCVVSTDRKLRIRSARKPAGR